MMYMPSIPTKNFGELNYDAGKVICFPEGLPGYPEDKQFVLLDMDETNDTFFWLQSIDDGDVCFPLMDVYKAIPDYAPRVEPDELSDLGGIAEGGLVIYNIAVIPGNISDTRVNLRAPVYINSDTRRAKQVICMNEEYAVRHYIMAQLRAAMQGANLC
jgi:flagellar assembly factor FliW